MPITVQGAVSKSSQDNQILQRDLGYSYPNGLDLRPRSELHKKIVNRIRERAQKSHNIMSRYKKTWREIDKVLRVYVPPEAAKEDSNKTKTKSGKNYADLIIPESYATMETILTYYMSSFMQDPIIQYDGVGPEDVTGAALLTHLIDHQVKKSGMGLNMHTMFRDDTAYGFGVLAPRWRRTYGRKPKLRQFGFMRDDNVFEITREEKHFEDDVLLYEGNEVENINPYLYLPDTSVPIHRPEKGEYVGWIEETTVYELLDLENDPSSDFFNARYLKKIDARSQFTVEGDKQKTRSTYNNDVSDSVVSMEADVIWMYIDIIPSEWGLGDAEYPKKWLFGLAGDEVLITAVEVDYLHERCPVVVSASNFDGYSVTPTSKLSIVHDIQTLINFMYTSHVHNVRKALNDMFIVDPSIINYYDLINPEPGKIIRTRRAAWGNQMLDNAFKQLNVTDVTQQHVGEAAQLGQLMQRVSATGDTMQGAIGGNRTTRVSAREAGGAIGASLSRFQKNAQIIDMQAMQPLAFLLAAHTQQYMENETYVKVAGELPERLMADLNDVDNRISIHPFDILIDYDIMPTNGQVPGSENPEVWTQLFQIASQSPVIGPQLDWIKLFKHIGRNLGAKNVDDFIVRVEPDEQVMQEAQAGNAITQEQAANV